MADQHLRCPERPPPEDNPLVEIESFRWRLAQAVAEGLALIAVVALVIVLVAIK